MLYPNEPRTVFSRYRCIIHGVLSRPESGYLQHCRNVGWGRTAPLREGLLAHVTSPPTLPYAPFHFAWLASEMLRRAQQHAEHDWFKDRSCDRLGPADRFALRGLQMTGMDPAGRLSLRNSYLFDYKYIVGLIRSFSLTLQRFRRSFP